MMADEENKPTPPTPPPTPFESGDAPEPVKEELDKSVRELRDVPVEAVPTEELPDIAKEVKETEPSEAREARRAAEETLNKPIEAIEDTVNAADKEDQAKAEHALPHRVGDTTVIRGYTIPLPLYTVVFLVLGAITILEVLVASLPDGIVGTLILIACSSVKAILVVLFYMHLREDSRMFALALILPLLIAVVASMFLLSVPPTGY
jgi:cytochrome c oxidase subunit 4